MLVFSKYFYTACITSYFTFFLMDKFGVSVQTSQLCLFVFLAAFAIGTVAGGMLGDKFGRKYVIWKTSVMMPICANEKSNLSFTIG
jgi:MFS transporter, FSR family, fosmidomycin resistance protein